MNSSSESPPDDVGDILRLMFGAVFQIPGGEAITGAAVSPDDNVLAIAGLTLSTATLQFIEISSGLTVKEFPFFDDSVAFSPNGQQFASGWVWDLQSETKLFHVGKNCRYTLNGTLIVAKDTEGFLFCDSKTGEVVYRVDEQHFRENFDVSRDGKLLVCWDWGCRVYDVCSNQLLYEHENPYAFNVECAISPDGQFLLVWDDHGWELVVRETSSFSVIERSTHGWEAELCFHPSGELIAESREIGLSLKEFAVGKRRLMVVDNYINELVRQIPLPVPEFNFSKPRFSPSGRSLSAIVNDRYAVVWNVSEHISVGRN